MRIKDWFSAIAVALASAVFYAFFTASFVYPDETARMVNVWLGLDTATYAPYPLMRFFALPFGASNFFSLGCLAVSVVLLYSLVCVFLRQRSSVALESKSQKIGTIGALAAAVVFIFSPGVREAAIRFDTGLFDTAWALLAFSLLIPFSQLPRKVSWIMPLLSGVMMALGMTDSIAFGFLMPFYFAAFWMVSLKSGGRGYGTAAIFFFAFLLAGVFAALPAIGDFKAYFDDQKKAVDMFFSIRLWFVIPLFAVLPFFASVFSSIVAFGGERGMVVRVFHAIVTVIAIFASVTQLSPEALMAPFGFSPVIFSVFTSVTIGYLFAYWWVEATSVKRGASHIVGLVGGGFLATVLFFALTIGFFFDFNPRAGGFADEVASRVLSDMGERSWLVTDGLIDDNIRRVAAENGKRLVLVSLRRENDVAYIERLAAAVKEAKIGGEKLSAELCEILLKHQGYRKNRLLPFLDHWFKNDPQVVSKVAVWGAPHIWMSSGIEPIPERYFFGGDPARKCDWTETWKGLDPVLGVSSGWGSYVLFNYKTARKIPYVDRVRYNYLRHIGLLATNQGCVHHFEGLRLLNDGKKEEADKAFAKAFSLYELVLGEIDADNVSALINEELLASKASFKKAKAKHKVIQAALKVIAEDQMRRYEPSSLFLLYGFICDPSFMLKYGQNLIARSGQFGHGMYQIRRAIDLIPAEQRQLAELNILASIYTDGAEKSKARKIYDEALVRDPSNRTALQRLAQLEMLDGNTEKAIEYLQRAMAGSEDDPQLFTQMAHLYLLKNQLDKAEAKLREATDLNPKDLHAWSLLAVTLMRKVDSLGEADKVKREELIKEIEDVIVPTMEKEANNTNDFFLQSTRAFTLIRKGGIENIRQARDSFVAISRMKPGANAASDVILSLDMQLDDKIHAEQQALRTLEIDRMHPMANYIMGSLMLGRDDFAAAEAHLRRAVSGPRPIPLAFNDLAEALRRQKKFAEAEVFARKAVGAAPKLYVVWETLGSILIDAGKDFEEAERCVQKACDLSKDSSGRVMDVRMLISLARVQLKRGEMLRAKGTMRTVLGRIDELSEFEKREFEELRKRVK